MAALVGHKPQSVNKQEMNGARHGAGTGGRSVFQAFYGSGKGARIIRVRFQRSSSRLCRCKAAPWEPAAWAGTREKPRAGDLAGPGKGSGLE